MDLDTSQGGLKMGYHILLTTIVFAFIADIAIAQLPSREKEEFVVAHRLSEWQTKHFEDKAKAEQHADAVKQLGAEVRVDNHETHVDVIYRSTNWKPLRIESDELAHQWEEWLKAAGFETLHGHSPVHDEHAHHEEPGHDEEKDDHDHHDEHGEVVLYRIPAWTAQHFTDAVAADQFITIAQALRCEVKPASHTGHTDIQFRCAKWMAVEFPDHKTAEKWAKFLASAGFEVRHEDDDHEK